MKICIIGTGYVGLVSAACFADMGNTVTCVDMNPNIIEKLTQGFIHIFEPGLEGLVQRNTHEKRLHFTTSLAEGLEGAECAFICVGTPPCDDGSCDLRYVENVAREIGTYMQNPLVIIDKSTVPVGTADRVRTLVQESLDRHNKVLQFEVVSNPEFLKEGNAITDFMKPDRIIIGTNSDWAVKLLREIYSPFIRKQEKMIVMNIRSAEMTKYAANCMLATKISFINEISTLCEKVGADVRDVRAGIGTDPRIGPHFIYPGLGYGGSCFPKDIKALINTAHQVGVIPELLEAVESVNKRQKKCMAERILAVFHDQGFVKGRTVALWGLAFKANTDDIRESAALDIIYTLTDAGVRVRAFDPVANANAQELLIDTPLASIEDDPYALCEQADALIIATEWNQFRNPDFSRIKALLKTPMIFDGRNLYNPETMRDRGFIYYCVGRKHDTP